MYKECLYWATESVIHVVYLIVADKLRKEYLSIFQFFFLQTNFTKPIQIQLTVILTNQNFTLLLLFYIITWSSSKGGKNGWTTTLGIKIFCEIDFQRPMLSTANMIRWELMQVNSDA